MIESESQTAAITDDMITARAGSDAEWSPAFDAYPNEAAETRVRMFDEWADGEVPVIGTHHSGQTAGQVRRWVPV